MRDVCHPDSGSAIPLFIFFVGSAKLFGIQDNREGTVIDQLDLHIRAKYAGLHRKFLAAFFDNIFIQFICKRGLPSLCEGGTVALLTVRIKRELAH